MSAPMPLVCGVGQPESVCGKPAVGVMAVQVHDALGSPERRPAVLLVCVEHLAGSGVQAQAVFEPGELPPGFIQKGA